MELLKSHDRKIEIGLPLDFDSYRVSFLSIINMLINHEPKWFFIPSRRIHQGILLHLIYSFYVWENVILRNPKQTKRIPKVVAVRAFILESPNRTFDKNNN